MVYSALEQVMKERGKNTAELAAEIGVPQSTLYDKMNGKTPMSVDMALGIKRALNTDMSVEALFERVVCE